MTTKIKAAVAHGVHEPMTIETLHYEDPVLNQVLIRIVASGLCHSDLHALDGSLPAEFPIVLGHEAGAIVEKCGPDVRDLQPGDHVVPLFSPECGICAPCTSGKTNLCQHFAATEPGGARLLWGDREVRQTGGIGAFATHAIVREYALAKIRKDAPLDRAFYTGCGVTTGFGASVYSARVQAGDKVVVFGLGGIGLNALQGARFAGASMVIGVDTNPMREEIARKLGATHFVNPAQCGDVVAALLALTGGGADHCIECVGNIMLMQQAAAALNPLWGVLTQVGVAPMGQTAPVAPFELLMGKKWQGSMFGGAKGRTDVPRIVDHYMDGDINIDDLVTHEIRLEDINEGFEMMKRGESIRAVIKFD